jgi:hypothetical protein
LISTSSTSGWWARLAMMWAMYASTCGTAVQSSFGTGGGGTVGGCTSRSSTVKGARSRTPATSHAGGPQCVPQCKASTQTLSSVAGHALHPTCTCHQTDPPLPGPTCMFCTQLAFML